MTTTMALVFLATVTTLCLVTSIDCRQSNKRSCTVPGLKWKTKGRSSAKHLPSGHLADGDFVPFGASEICMQCENGTMKFASCKELMKKNKTIQEDKKRTKYHSVFKRHHRRRGRGHHGRGNGSNRHRHHGRG